MGITRNCLVFLELVLLAARHWPMRVRAKLRCGRMLDQDGPDSVGPWSILVFFSCWKLRDCHQGWPGICRMCQMGMEKTEAFCTFTWAPQSGPRAENSERDEPLDGWVPMGTRSSMIFNQAPTRRPFRCVYPEFEVLDYLRHIPSTASIAMRRVILDGSHCAAAGLHHKPLVMVGNRVKCWNILAYGRTASTFMEAEIACTSTLIHVFGAVVHLLKISSPTWPGISLFFPMFPARGHSEHRILSNLCQLRCDLDSFCWKNMKKHMTSTWQPLLANLGFEILWNPCMSALGSFALAVFHKTTLTLPLSQTAAASSC